MHISTHLGLILLQDDTVDLITSLSGGNIPGIFVNDGLETNLSWVLQYSANIRQFRGIFCLVKVSDANFGTEALEVGGAAAKC